MGPLQKAGLMLALAVAKLAVLLTNVRGGLGSVGIQDSHPKFVVIQAMDGPIRFD
jgi:hypothetical protein